MSEGKLELHKFLEISKPGRRTSVEEKYIKHRHHEHMTKGMMKTEEAEGEGKEGAKA